MVSSVFQSDLVHTIGESAALGASGVVLWGSSEYARSQVTATDTVLQDGPPQLLWADGGLFLPGGGGGRPGLLLRRETFCVLQKNCLTVKKFIDGQLGHYVINVTSATKLCSKALCKKNGRCVRKRLDSGAYLHLNAASFRIHHRATPSGRRLHVSGRLTHEHILDMKHKFTCQCYQGWTGVYCEMPQAPPCPPGRPLQPVQPSTSSLLTDVLVLLSVHFSCLCITVFLGLCLIIKSWIL